MSTDLNQVYLDRWKKSLFLLVFLLLLLLPSFSLLPFVFVLLSSFPFLHLYLLLHHMRVASKLPVFDKGVTHIRGQALLSAESGMLLFSRHICGGWWEESHGESNVWDLPLQCVLFI